MLNNLILPTSKNTNSGNTEIKLNNNSIIFIGANGAGKTNLGAWIERRESENVHRISAQKVLNFKQEIELRSFELSTNLLTFGTKEKSSNHDNRWYGNVEKCSYTTSLLNDYEYVLSAFIAKLNNENAEVVKKAKEFKGKNIVYSDKIDIISGKLYKIWEDVFPQRNIRIKDNKLLTSYNTDETEKIYNGNEMSDGERVALYLILQALVVPENKTIIIDEPELHLHRSLMNRLFNAIEEERQDCLFVYITHDTEFASLHKQAKKIWVKSFDGENWDWEEIQESELPEELLLNILGNRKPVVFVEGEKGSYDAKLFSEVYKDYYVKPCGGCAKVIENTKAMKNTSQLHDLKCYGIIDRDYRTDKEISELEKDGIFVLKVAEIENLFLIPELLKIVSKLMGFQDEKGIDDTQRYVIEERFSKEINKQILQACKAEIKHKLSSIDISNKNDEEINKEIEGLNDYIKYEEIKQKVKEEFQSALNNKNYENVLKFYNQKSLVKSIGRFFNLKNSDYCDYILRQLRTDNSKTIIEALLPYLPSNEQIPKTFA